MAEFPRFGGVGFASITLALEERGQFLPGWISRYIFRPFIGPIIRKLEMAAPKDN